MSLRPDNTLISNREVLLELLATPFRAAVRLVENLGTSAARAQTLQHLSTISDEELKARGLTRAEIVSMAFRHDA